jgi:GGDEF domain-containing protein
MVTGVVAACAALVACGLTLLVLHRSRRSTERRLQGVLERIDTHLAAVSASVESAVGRMVETQSRLHAQPSLDLERLVEAIAAEAASLTGADAVFVEVEGPNARTIVASAGSGASRELVDSTIASKARGYETATIEWTYDEAGSAASRFAAALLTPLGRSAAAPGVVVAFSETPGAFRAEHGAALRALVAEYGNALANARRFAEIEARLRAADAPPPVPERTVAEQLEREVARARESGRPLSVVLVGLTNGTGTSTADGAGALAQVVDRVTRRGDIACRHGEREVAILLPGTNDAGASVLTRRLRAEVSRSLAGEPLTVGHVEWHRGESAHELGSRLGTLRGTRRRTLATTGRADEALRRDALDTLAHEVEQARLHGRRLAVAVLDVEGPSALETLGEQLLDAVGGGSAHRLGSVRFALVLPATDVDRAEALVDSLGALEPAVTISAGVTELVERDDADSLLGRAEHALWQARQAGRGTVVVAVPGRRTPPVD